MTELALLTGDIASARTLGEEAVSLAEAAGACQEQIHAAMVRGMVAAGEQMWADALTDLERARDIAQETGHRYGLAKTQAQLAALHLQRGGDGDRQRATQYSAAARELFAALGAKTDLERLPQP